MIQLLFDGVVFFEGYIDKAYPVSEDVRSMTYEIVGRDYGQDLHNKLVNKSVGWKFPDQPADDIIDLMLSQASSEITYASPSTAPNLMYTDEGEEYLIEAIRKIAEKIDYDFWVDEYKVLHLFPIGSVDSPIVLNCVTGEINNVISIKINKFDAFELRNKIQVTGREISDGWSEGNKDDYGKLGTNVVTDDYAVIASGIAGVRCSKGAETTCELSLTFPKFNYTYLPFDSFDDSKISASFFISGAAGKPAVYLYLTDTNGSIIQFFLLGGNAWARDSWKQIDFPIGNEYTDQIKDWDASKQHLNWFYLDAASEALGFNWQIVDIKFVANLYEPPTTVNYFVLDGLTIPLQMIAMSEDATSQALYKVRQYPITARNIVTQMELDRLADDELAKRKNPIGSVTVTAIGSAGIVGVTNWWRQGYNLILNSPEDSMNNVKLRMTDIHHILKDDPEHGSDWTVEVTLVPYNTPVSGSRLSYIESPEVALFREMSKRLRFMEKALDANPSMPPASGSFSSQKIDWWNIPTARIVDGLLRLKETVDDNWLDLQLQLFEDMAFPAVYNPFFHVEQGCWFQKDVFSQGFLGCTSRIVIEFGGTYTPAVEADIGKTVKDDAVYCGTLVGYWNSATDYKNLPTSVAPGDPTAPTWWLVAYYPIASGSTMTIPSGTGGGITNLIWTTQPGGGAIMCGHGLTGVADPPKMVLSSSALGFDRFHFVDIADALADIAVKDIELTSVNGAPFSGGMVGERGFATTEANGLDTITFAAEFDDIPHVHIQPIDATGRPISIVVTEITTTTFSIKAMITTRGTTSGGSAHLHGAAGTTGAGSQHRHSTAGTTGSGSAHTHTIGGADGAHPHTPGNESSHTHAVGGTTGYIYDGAPGEEHNHSSGGPGVEETTGGTAHTHTISGADGTHSHAPSNESSHTHYFAEYTDYEQTHTHTYSANTGTEAGHTHTHSETVAAIMYSWMAIPIM